MTAVGLDGRPVKVVRRRRRPRHLRPTNIDTTGKNVVERQDEDEWQAYDSLPQVIRDFLRERMTIDQSTVDVMAQWEVARRRGESPQGFVRYLERLNVIYLNQTMDVWPSGRPPFTGLPR